MDGLDDDDLVKMKALRSCLLHQRATALTELSASIFNRPELHDAVRASASFRKLQSLDERLRGIDTHLHHLERGLDPQGPCG